MGTGRTTLETCWAVSTKAEYLYNLCLSNLISKEECMSVSVCVFVCAYMCVYTCFNIWRIPRFITILFVIVSY